MKLTLLVAMDQNRVIGRVIGRAGGLPWHLPADLRRFKQLTLGHTIIMGRKTYESIGRPLPGRTTIVLTRQSDFQPNGVQVAATLEAALAQVAHQDEVFVVGGAEIYEQALPLADRLLITQVEAQVDGDTYFPTFDPQQWERGEVERHPADEKHSYAYSFHVLNRQGSAERATDPATAARST